MESRPARHWIIFSYFANIDGKAASQHLDDRLPCLRALGVEPLLVSSPCGAPRTDLPHFRVPSSAPSGIRFELRYLRKSSPFLKIALLPALLAVLPFYLLEKIIINLDSQWSWFPLAFLRGMLLCRSSQRPELVYSTGGPASAHVAAALLSRFAGIPWIAELQDPLVYEDYPRSASALKVGARIERLIMTRASAVVFLAEGAREKALSRTGADPEKARVIYPGASPVQEPRGIYAQGGFCRFAHFGSLGGSRNVETFLEGLRVVFRENPKWAGMLRFDLYGTMDGVSRKLIENFEYPDVVTDFGKVSRRDALLAMQKSDVLVLIQNRDKMSPETIPSKIYEYFQMNRPIIGLVHHNPQLSSMISGLGHLAVPADSAEETGKAILALAEKWQHGVAAAGSPSPYTVETAARRLVGISGQVTGSRA